MQKDPHRLEHGFSRHITKILSNSPSKMVKTENSYAIRSSLPGVRRIPY